MQFYKVPIPLGCKSLIKPATWHIFVFELMMRDWLKLRSPSGWNLRKDLNSWWPFMLIHIYIHSCHYIYIFIAVNIHSIEMLSQIPSDGDGSLSQSGISSLNTKMSLVSSEICSQVEGPQAKVFFMELYHMWRNICNFFRDLLEKSIQRKYNA